jgi:hypothetical protein
MQDKFTRAAKGGSGGIKAVGNYAGALLPQVGFITSLGISLDPCVFGRGPLYDAMREASFFRFVADSPNIVALKTAQQIFEKCFSCRWRPRRKGLTMCCTSLPILLASISRRLALQIFSLSRARRSTPPA